MSNPVKSDFREKGESSENWDETDGENGLSGKAVIHANGRIDVHIDILGIDPANWTMGGPFEPYTDHFGITLNDIQRMVLSTVTHAERDLEAGGRPAVFLSKAKQ